MTAVITTRNDGHGGFQLPRLRAFVRGLAEYRAALDWDLELVVVEWNPPQERPRLKHVMEWPEWARIVTVPESVHCKFANSDVLPLFFHIGQNVGIRRARGDWVLCTSQDVIFSEKLARFLANENFNEWSFYRATRMNTSARTVPDGPVAEVVAFLDERVIKIRRFIDEKRLHTFASGDFILMHKSAWERLRGFPEFELFGTFLDGFVLHAAFTSGMEQVALDESRCFYHIDHSAMTKEKLAEVKLPRLDYGDDYKLFCHWMIQNEQPIIVNDENWGLKCDSRIR